MRLPHPITHACDAVSDPPLELCQQCKNPNQRGVCTCGNDRSLYVKPPLEHDTRHTGDLRERIYKIWYPEPDYYDETISDDHMNKLMDLIREEKLKVIDQFSNGAHDLIMKLNNEV